MNKNTRIHLTTGSKIPHKTLSKFYLAYLASTSNSRTFIVPHTPHAMYTLAQAQIVPNWTTAQLIYDPSTATSTATTTTTTATFPSLSTHPSFLARAPPSSDRSFRYAFALHPNDSNARATPRQHPTPFNVIVHSPGTSPRTFEHAANPRVSFGSDSRNTRCRGTFTCRWSPSFLPACSMG